LRCSRHITALPFKLKMAILAFSFPEYSWILKYFFIPRSHAYTCCPVLLSPSKLGGFYFRNYPYGWSLWNLLLLELLDECPELSDEYLDPPDLPSDVSDGYALAIMLCEPFLGLRNLPQEWLLTLFLSLLPLFQVEPKLTFCCRSLKLYSMVAFIWCFSSYAFANLSLKLHIVSITSGGVTCALLALDSVFALPPCTYYLMMYSSYSLGSCASFMMSISLANISCLIC